MKTVPPLLPLETVDARDLPDFTRDDGRPVLVKATWPAIGRWSLQSFKERFGSEMVKGSMNLPNAGTPYDHKFDDHIRTLSFGEFVDSVEANRDTPCYVIQFPLSRWGSLEADLDFGSFFSQKLPWSVTNLWIGSGGTLSGLHWDAVHNLFLQAYGRKRIYLVPPESSRCLQPMHHNITKSPIAPNAPDLEKFPDYSKATVYTATLEAGDVLFIPRFWWHFLESLDPSISVSHWFGRTATLREYAGKISECGVSYWGSFAKQFVWNGLLRQRRGRPLFGAPTNGEMLYELIESRLLGKQASDPYWH